MQRSQLRPLALAVCIATVGIVAWIVFHNTVRGDFFPKRWVEIESGKLYRSGQLSRKLVKETLVQHKIGLVVDLAYNELEWAEDRLAEEAAVAELGISHVRYPLNGDGTGDVEQYALAIAEIEGAMVAGVPTLVHCAAGSRRSAGVIAGYLVLVEGRPAEVGYRELARYGAGGEPLQIITRYLNENMAALAARLVELGAVESVPVPLPQFILE